MAGPGDEVAAATPGRGGLRASHADREQVIGALKVAFVEGRLTEDEFDARLGQVYASRTYAELAAVTADIPAGLTGIQPTRDPWRATKLAGRTVYAIILPAIVTLIALPGGRGNPSMAAVITTAVVTYLLFWLGGVSVMVYSRQEKRSRGKLPPRSAPGAGIVRPPALCFAPSRSWGGTGHDTGGRRDSSTYRSPWPSKHHPLRPRAGDRHPQGRVRAGSADRG
jgi:hypothetical protein